MKKTLLAAATTVAAVTALGSPAAADAPTAFTDQFSFQEPDPCDPDTIQTTTLTFDAREHDHGNVTVLVVGFTAETDTGYFGTGRNTIVSGANHFSDTQTAIVTNADGDRYKVDFHVNGTPNGIATEQVKVRCLSR